MCLYKYIAWTCTSKKSWIMVVWVQTLDLYDHPIQTIYPVRSYPSWQLYEGYAQRL